MSLFVNPNTGSSGRPPAFDLAVPQDGYRWWYLDGVSSDRRFGVVIILFVGSVFSPYYHRARQQGRGDPEAYCALNVALYGPKGRWAMTERQAVSAARSPDRFLIGPSAVSWKDGVLRYQINERCTPFGQRLSGEIAAYPGPACPLDVDLDGQGRHHWTPWSPHARVAVKLNHPQLAWEGNAYLDANAGSEPLERAFHSWDWSRTEYADRSRLHYEVQLRNGQERLFAFDIDAQGQAEEVTADPVESLRRTGWGLQRYPRCGHGIVGVQSFEDTPFYSRTLLRGPEASPISVHERLSMDRFVAPWVRCLLPFRMPRELAGSRQPRAHRS